MAEMKTWGMFIGGEWVDRRRGEDEPDINPATGETIAEVPVGTQEDADRAVAAAQKAYDEVWFDTPPKERSAMLLKLADAMDADADELARARVDRRRQADRRLARPTSRSSPTTSGSSPARRGCSRASRPASTSGASRA